MDCALSSSRHFREAVCIWSRPPTTTSFVLLNISPQFSGILLSGIWRPLERKCSSMFHRCYCYIWHWCLAVKVSSFENKIIGTIQMRVLFWKRVYLLLRVASVEFSNIYVNKLRCVCLYEPSLLFFRTNGSFRQFYTLLSAFLLILASFYNDQIKS